jgi:hypothetical protein
MKNWNWYLDTPVENSDSEIENDDFTEEASTSISKSSSRKKRGKEGEDEDWIGGSDEDKDLISKDANSLKGSKYATRSQNLKKPRKERVINEDVSNIQNEEVDDEDDETLGGFIVTGKEENEEMNSKEEEEEEEEFEDEELDD